METMEPAERTRWMALFFCIHEQRVSNVGDVHQRFRVPSVAVAEGGHEGE